MIVTRRAPQLYAQSLRGGNKPQKDKHNKAPSQATEVKTPNLPVPLWLIATGGSALVTVAFMAGAYWSDRRTKPQLQLPTEDTYIHR